jgi:hypothetical protein
MTQLGQSGFQVFYDYTVTRKLSVSLCVFRAPRSRHIGNGTLRWLVGVTNYQTLQQQVQRRTRRFRRFQEFAVDPCPAFLSRSVGLWRAFGF